MNMYEQVLPDRLLPHSSHILDMDLEQLYHYHHHDSLSSVLMPGHRFFAEYGGDWIAGWLGGIAGMTFGHPFDTIKVRMQTHSDTCPNSWQTIKTTYKNENIMGFFKGLAFPLATVGVLNSIFFGVYGNTLKHLAAGRSKDTPTRYYGNIFAAGAVAGAVQAVPATTIDLVKIRLQANMSCPVATASHVGVNGTLALAPAVNGGASSAVYTGPMHCIASIYRQGGLRGCFRGFGATLLREVPGLSVYITTYEYLLDRFSSEGSNSIASPGIMLLAGGLAGTCSWFCNMPCDVIKSRIQADRIVNPEYNGIVDCIRKSYAKEGIRVFYRGLAITCIRAFPVNAVTFYVYKLSLNEFQVWAAEEELPE